MNVAGILRFGGKRAQVARIELGSYPLPLEEGQQLRKLLRSRHFFRPRRVCSWSIPAARRVVRLLCHHEYGGRSDAPRGCCGPTPSDEQSVKFPRQYSSCVLQAIRSLPFLPFNPQGILRSAGSSKPAVWLLLGYLHGLLRPILNPFLNVCSSMCLLMKPDSQNASHLLHIMCTGCTV
jgi:hypothetical protein